MGTAKLQPEPLIGHLRRALSQLQEHRWRQFSCVTGRGEAWLTSPRPHLRADCHWGRISFWTLLLVEFFLWAYDMGEHFHLFLIIPFQHNNLSSCMICRYQPNHTTLYICWLYNWWTKPTAITTGIVIFLEGYWWFWEWKEGSSCRNIRLWAAGVLYLY